MDNPFDREEGSFLVLVNAEGQYSLWPEFRDVPVGWRIAHPAAGRQVCLDWIEAHWVTLRPQAPTAPTRDPPAATTDGDRSR